MRDFCPKPKKQQFSIRRFSRPKQKRLDFRRDPRPREARLFRPLFRRRRAGNGNRPKAGNSSPPGKGAPLPGKTRRNCMFFCFCCLPLPPVYARAQACVCAYTRTTSPNKGNELKSLQVFSKKESIRLVSGKKACEVATAQCVP